MLQERGEPQLLIRLCRMTYPLQRTERVFPARCPGLVSLLQVPFSLTASLHPLRPPFALGCPVLFGDFVGTVGLSDLPRPFFIGVRP